MDGFKASIKDPLGNEIIIRRAYARRMGVHITVLGVHPSRGIELNLDNNGVSALRKALELFEV